MNWRRWFPLLIVAAGIVAYHGSFSGAFIFDDHGHILTNQRIQRWWPPWDALGGTARPLVQLSLALNYATGGLNPWDYHAFNLVVHLLAGLTLYGVLRRSLVCIARARRPPTDDQRLGGIVGQAPRLADRSVAEPAAGGAPTLQEEERRTAATLAGIIALIWVVHPLNTQAVTYIIQRGESMMGLFYLLTLYCFIRGVDMEDHRPEDRALEPTGVAGQSLRLASRSDNGPAAGGAPALQAAETQKPQETVALQSERDHSSRLRRSLWFAASIIACFLGMICKEVMVTAPLMVLLYDQLVVGRKIKRELRWRLWFYAVLFALCLVPVALSMMHSAGDSSAGFTMKTVTPWQYVLTQPSVILHYLCLVFWPVDLCFDYLWPVAKGYWQIVPPLLVVSGMVALTFSLLYRSSALALPGLWFFGILSVTSSIMPIADIAVEHRMYLPLISVIGLLALVGYDIMTRLIVNFHRNDAYMRTWIQGMAMVGVTAVCVILAYQTVKRNQDYNSPLAMWEKTAQLRPANIRVHLEVAGVYFNHQMPELAKLHCRKVVGLAEATTGHFGAGLWLAKAYFFAENDDGTERQLQLILQERPNGSMALNLKGLLRYRQGRDQEAADLFAEAIRFNPHWTDFYLNHGLALMRLGRLIEAKASFLKVIEQAPASYVAYHQLGNIHALEGQEGKAIETWRRALSINPDYVPSLTALVWVLSVSTHPDMRDGSQALALGQHLMTLRLQPTSAMLEAVAAAYAENNRFDTAIQLLEQARQRTVPARTDTTIIPTDGMDHRMELYRSGKPYRAPARNVDSTLNWQKAEHQDCQIVA